MATIGDIRLIPAMEGKRTFTTDPGAFISGDEEYRKEISEVVAFRLLLEWFSEYKHPLCVTHHWSRDLDFNKERHIIEWWPLVWEEVYN